MKVIVCIQSNDGQLKQFIIEGVDVDNLFVQYSKFYAELMKNTKAGLSNNVFLSLEELHQRKDEELLDSFANMIGGCVSPAKKNPQTKSVHRFESKDDSKNEPAVVDEWVFPEIEKHWKQVLSKFQNGLKSFFKLLEQAYPDQNSDAIRTLILTIQQYRFLHTSVYDTNPIKIENVNGYVVFFRHLKGLEKDIHIVMDGKVCNNRKDKTARNKQTFANRDGCRESKSNRSKLRINSDVCDSQVLQMRIIRPFLTVNPTALWEDDEIDVDKDYSMAELLENEKILKWLVKIMSQAEIALEDEDFEKINDFVMLRQLGQAANYYKSKPRFSMFYHLTDNAVEKMGCKVCDILYPLSTAEAPSIQSLLIKAAIELEKLNGTLKAEIAKKTPVNSVIPTHSNSDSTVSRGPTTT